MLRIDYEDGQGVGPCFDNVTGYVIAGTVAAWKGRETARIQPCLRLAWIPKYVASAARRMREVPLQMVTRLCGFCTCATNAV